MTTFDTYNLTLLRSPLRSERDKESVKSPIKQKARKLQTRKSDRSALEWSKDLELIKTNKSEAAFARLFYHFAPRVKAFLIKSGADVGLAEECAQEVMVTVWNKAHLFDPSRASASTWIFTIARNKKIDALRKQLRPTPDDLGWGPEHEPDQEEMPQALQKSR